ncbi:MAG: pneumococcal-type histidine triad protein, partial [Porphyromonadaceae bacterium]|nr:pneumococcal-type histidine triad protein [Porphyromonadaceae bacterium]
MEAATGHDTVIGPERLALLLELLLLALLWADHEEVEDGYVFDKKDVVSETETGYIVRHGDHFHFIYKDKQGNPVVTTEHHE